MTSSPAAHTTPRVTTAHEEAWHRHGYTIIENLLTADELEGAREALARYVPSAAEFETAPERYAKLELMHEFPFSDDRLNDIAVHPELVAFAERLLRTDDLHLTECLTWTKYAGTADYEQPLHLDYGNNQLVYPRRDSTYGQVAAILYYEDVTEELGPTWVLPRDKTPPAIYWPSVRSKEDHPELYEHQRPVTLPAGSVFVYSIDTFHRGSRFTAPSGRRVSQHMVFAAWSSRWISWRGWGHHAMEPNLRRFLERATPRQRCLLGFPAPGDPYWNDETLAGVGARYPGMDMNPYKEARS